MESEKLERRIPYYVQLVNEAVKVSNISGFVLDVGCGPGTSTVMLKDSLPNAKIVGIDNNKNYIEAAKLKNHDIMYACEDCYNMSFQDEYFDGCFALNLFEVLEKPVVALAEMRRTVRKGGIICAVDIDYDKIYVYPEIPYLNRLNRVNCLLKKKKGYDVHAGSLLEKYFKEVGINNCKQKEIELSNTTISGFENTLLYRDKDENYLIDAGFFKKEEFEEMYNYYERVKANKELVYSITYTCCYGIV